MTDPPAIAATEIVKSFGSSRAVDRASLTLEAGELVALLGPSGSGKTTMLRVIAGFERPDEGLVEIAGRRVAGPGTWVEPEDRRVGMVFQDGALFPHLTTMRNVAFGEPRPGRAEECLELVGLAHRADSYPHELSGGERQRVALARALATDPEVVLLDEPFASLDTGLRESLRAEVASILRTAGASALLVTHDQQEALSLADRLVIMRDGQVHQAGRPEEVYARPANRWVASFLGAAEVLPGIASAGVVDTDLGRLRVEGDRTGPVEVMVRPEALVCDLPGDDDRPGTPARIASRSYFGHDQLLHLELESGRQVRCRTGGSRVWDDGEAVLVRVEGRVHILADSSE